MVYGVGHRPNARRYLALLAGLSAVVTTPPAGAQGDAEMSSLPARLERLEASVKAHLGELAQDGPGSTVLRDEDWRDLELVLLAGIAEMVTAPRGDGTPQDQWGQWRLGRLFARQQLAQPEPQVAQLLYVFGARNLPSRSGTRAAQRPVSLTPSMRLRQAVLAICGLRCEVEQETVPRLVFELRGLLEQHAGPERWGSYLDAETQLHDFQRTLASKWLRAHGEVDEQIQQLLLARLPELVAAAEWPPQVKAKLVWSPAHRTAVQGGKRQQDAILYRLIRAAYTGVDEADLTTVQHLRRVVAERSAGLREAAAAQGQQALSRARFRLALARTQHAARFPGRWISEVH